MYETQMFLNGFNFKMFTSVLLYLYLAIITSRIYLEKSPPYICEILPATLHAPGGLHTTWCIQTFFLGTQP